MYVLFQLCIPQIEHELKDGLIYNDIFKSITYNFLCTHLKIKVNIILSIIFHIF